MLKNKLYKLKNSKFLANTSWILFIQIFYMIVSFLVSAISARTLNSENYGIYNYCYSIVMIFTSVSTLGFDSVLVKELVNNRQNNGKILGSSIFFRLCSSVLVIILSCITIIILKPNEKIFLIVSLILSSMYIFKSFDLIEIWFQSNLMSKYSSIAKFIATLVTFLFKCYVLFIMHSLILFSVCIVLDQLLICILYLYIYKNNNGQKLKIEIKTGNNLLKISYSFILSTLLISLYTKLDQIMIGYFLPIKFVGYYSVATFFETSWYFIPSAIINSAKPVIFDATNQSEDEQDRKTKILYATIFWLGVIVTFMFLLFSKYIITFVYGVEYLPAVQPTSIIMGAGIFAMVGSVRAIWLLNKNLQKYTVYFVSFGVFLNIILNYLLIPVFGLNGAAFATLATQFFQVIIFPLLFKKTRKCSKVLIEGIIFKW